MALALAHDGLGQRYPALIVALEKNALLPARDAGASVGMGGLLANEEMNGRRW